MIKVNITYDIVTPKSAENVDFAESGFVSEDQEFNSKDDALEYFGQNYGSYYQGNEHSYYTNDPDVDYKTGNETTYAIHF